MDPVCLLCLHELLHSNHNSLFCHLLYTVSVNFFAGPGPGPRGLDSVTVQTPLHWGQHAAAPFGQRGLTQAQAARRRAELCQHPRRDGGQKQPPPPGPGNQEHIPCFILPPDRATGSSQPVELPKARGCWAAARGGTWARLAGAGAQRFSQRGSGPHVREMVLRGASVAGAGTHTYTL